MTNVSGKEVKQAVEKKAVQKVPLRGRFDIVVRKLQGEYSTANGWAITANNLIANQLTVVVERVAPNHATGGVGGEVGAVASTADAGGNTEDKIEVAKLSTTVDATTEAPKTITKRATKTATKKTED